MNYVKLKIKYSLRMSKEEKPFYNNYCKCEEINIITYTILYDQNNNLLKKKHKTQQYLFFHKPLYQSFSYPEKPV